MPVYLHPFYRDFYSQNNIKVHAPVSDEEWKKMLTLPLYPSMTEDEVRQVIEGVKSFRR